MSRELERRGVGPLPSLDPAGEAELARRAQYALADSWADEAARSARQTSRNGWILSFILIVVCGAQAAAIAIMLPLKEVVPYTLLVDRQTGYIETVRGVRLGDLPEDQAVVQAFLAQYVLARETFDAADFDARYRQVALWSADGARTGFVDTYSGGAPDGLSPDSRVAVTIKSITLSDDRSAVVRFETLRRDPGREPVRTDWRAAVGYRFSGAPMRMEDRLVNPLGFQAVSYRRDRETPVSVAAAPVPEDAPAIPATAAPPPRPAPPRAARAPQTAAPTSTDAALRGPIQGPEN